jgi:hypothetical protein
VRTRLAIVVALGAALVALPTAAFGDSSRHAANSVTFQDSTGEDAAAPDVTGIVVSNDDAGSMTFQVNIGNRPALTPDMFMLIFLDTDQNASTGDTNTGAEYVIQLEPGSVGLFRWNGSDFLAAPSQASLTYAYSPTGATIRINASDFGKPKAFRFATLVASGVTTNTAGEPDFTNIHTDAAPDPGHGLFAYQVLTRLILTVTAFTVSPKPASAGRPFSVSLAANQNDTGGPVQRGTATCAATIALKPVAAVSHVVANGVASCVWRIPKTAKGKLIRGTITLTVQGVQVTRPFLSRIS